MAIETSWRGLMIPRNALPLDCIGSMGPGIGDVCGWEEHTQYREGSDGSWIAGTTKIEHNRCGEGELRSK